MPGEWYAEIVDVARAAFRDELETAKAADLAQRFGPGRSVAGQVWESCPTNPDVIRARVCAKGHKEQN